MADDSVAALVRDLLSQRVSVRIEVTGASMSPCIRSGDVVTIVPPPAVGFRLGDVVVVGLDPGRLLVHRVVARAAGGVVTWGDAAPGSDAPPAGRTVLGVVSRVERAGRPVRFGLGRERWVIALAQRWGLLRLSRAVAGRLGRAAGLWPARTPWGVAGRGA